MNDYDKEKINFIVTRGSFTGHDIYDEVGHAVHHNNVWRPVQDGTFGIIFESGLQQCARNGVEAYEY